MGDEEYRKMREAENELRDHLRRRDEIIAEGKKNSAGMWIIGVLASAMGDHSITMGNAILGGARKLELRDHEKAIAEIHRKYPQLRAAFEPDAARDAMHEVRESKSLTRLHHTRLKAKGSLYQVQDVNGDGSLDEDYGDHPADYAWGFIRGCNRVLRTSDGWEHYWKERE